MTIQNIRNRARLPENPEVNNADHPNINTSLVAVLFSTFIASQRTRKASAVHRTPREAKAVYPIGCKKQLKFKSSGKRIRK